MITKEKFFEILDYLQETNEFENNLSKVFKNSKRATDFMDAAMFTDCYMIEYILDLLEDEFNDTNHWISYWVYELNFGKLWSPGMIIDKNEKDIKLQTKKDLYNFLMENKFEILIGGTD